MKKTYMELFKDGALMFSRVKPTENDLQKGTHVFEINQRATIEDIQDWLGQGCPPKYSAGNIELKFVI